MVNSCGKGLRGGLQEQFPLPKTPRKPQSRMFNCPAVPIPPSNHLLPLNLNSPPLEDQFLHT